MIHVYRKPRWWRGHSLPGIQNTHFNFAARFLVHQISWPRMQGKLLLDEIKYCFVLLAQEFHHPIFRDLPYSWSFSTLGAGKFSHLIYKPSSWWPNISPKLYRPSLHLSLHSLEVKRTAWAYQKPLCNAHIRASSVIDTQYSHSILLRENVTIKCNVCILFQLIPIAILWNNQWQRKSKQL